MDERTLPDTGACCQADALAAKHLPIQQWTDGTAKGNARGAHCQQKSYWAALFRFRSWTFAITLCASLLAMREVARWHGSGAWSAVWLQACKHSVLLAVTHSRCVSCPATTKLCSTHVLESTQHGTRSLYTFLTTVGICCADERGENVPSEACVSLCFAHEFCVHPKESAQQQLCSQQERKPGVCLCSQSQHTVRM